MLVFYNWLLYIQISDVIPGVNIIGRKARIVSVNGAGGSGGVLRNPAGVLGDGAPKEKF